MVYLKSFLFGIGGAVLVAILWFTLSFISRPLESPIPITQRTPVTCSC
jgi:hypothetical protein